MTSKLLSKPMPPVLIAKEKSRASLAGLAGCKVAALVSGGVDSAVALAFLKEAGADVTAFYLKIWLQDEWMALGNCPWEEDLAYLRPIARQWNVPLRVISFQNEYWEQVIEESVRAIRRGVTPNPDMYCNARIKFGLFYTYMRKYFPKLEYMASGHYSQLVWQAEKKGAGACVGLKCAPDPIKDQTYFLAQLTQAQLQRCLFPIGHLTKREVRALAKEYGLSNQDRKDSQGLCFLGKIRFRDFIRFHLGERKGDIIDKASGTVLGKHAGYWYYTIGQRQGLDLSGGPWYVVEKDVRNNRVYVGRRERTFCWVITIGALHWLSDVLPLSGAYEVKLRHGGKRHKCRLQTLSNRDESAGKTAKTNVDKEVKEAKAQLAACYEVTLAEAEAGVAAGQFAVFYSGEFCVASAVIVATVIE